MLLNIDKVLLLISEGKDIDKIAKIASVTSEEVAAIVNSARELLAKYEPDKTRKKITIRKKIADQNHSDLFLGADLAAIPVEGNLRIYAAVATKPQSFSAGILINDESGTQIGKIHYNFQDKNAKDALLQTVLKSCRIAKYFKAKSVRIYIDDAPVHRSITGLEKPTEQSSLDILDQLDEIKSSFRDFRIELVSRQQNENARYISARKVSKKTKE